ncbi:MAG: tRNA (adenosine(37)-N6)-dimethylallyltransferase MiaA [Phototrophicaceae bacterium]
MAGNYLVVILGATAVGKTQLAIHLAQHLNGEIIGADSRQIYRHMDIGTAKPTPEQQQLVSHHLIDLVEPDYLMGLAEYQRMAQEKITSLHAQGKLPLLVGGTGQYLSAIIEGWSIPVVPPNDELRTTYEAFAQTHGASALHEILAKLDPTSAQAIHPNNTRRVIRALEVTVSTGTPMSILQQKRPPNFPIYIVGLEMIRELLYERADLRFNHMVEHGLLAEVEWLHQQGYAKTLPSMSGIGYRQLVEYLEGSLPYEQALSESKFLTHDFIRRQITWFKGHDNGIVWQNATTLNPDHVVMNVRQWMENQHD